MVARTVRHMAVQDWLIVTYFLVFLLALVFGSGPDRPANIHRILTDMTVLAVGFLLTRGQILRPGTPASSLVYRFTLFGTVFTSYFQLQHLLPAVSGRSIDAEIYALDLRIFGFEPAVRWDAYVTPVTTEWFAFFYFSYFALLCLHILPFLLVVRDTELTARFSLGIFTVFCTAHLLYMAVPGFGPYRYLAQTFQHELTGGLFWRLVQEAVTGAGAQKDIFPSLHTGVPTFFLFFSLQQRKRAPFKYTWPVVGFFASQIIIATMFLRWHYLIDICAGITLAAFATWFAGRVQIWERARRERLGVPPVFSRAFSPAFLGRENCPVDAEGRLGNGPRP